MRAPISWIRDYVDLPADVTAADLAGRLTALGLKLEAIDRPGHDVAGPLVVGRVLTREPEKHSNGKTVNWCTVDVGAANGTGEPQGIVCGAHNFTVGDLVVVVLPGGVLPGGFEISARKTYGHVSAGMICSAGELGLGEDAASIKRGGIIVLPPGAGEPGDDLIEEHPDVLHLREEVIEFEINPDRAYALSLRGIAREAALAYAAPYVDPALRETPAPDDKGYPVEVEDRSGCPVFATRTVTGVDPAAPTPDWLARRVQLAGMRSISLAVDVTNYVMLELGQPIHGYDRDRLRGPIRVRRATAGERLTTLDDVERVLSAEDLLITDDSGPIGLAGVMGGQATELSDRTRDIVIEAAHFDPVSIFRTQRRHKLPSEASRRFERGVDPTIPAAAADRVAELLATYGGGVVEAGATVVGTPPGRESITAATDLAARVTGMPIDEDTTLAHLRAVGCEVRAGGRELTVLPPPWRPDLTDPFDLVEEVARLVGYDRVPSVLPPAPAGRGLTTGQRLRRRVGRTLAGLGYCEVLTFPFVGEADLDRLGLDRRDPRRQALGLANPLSAQAPMMTTTLLPGLLQTLARNVGRGNADPAVFETGTVTLPGDGRPAPVLPVTGRPSAAQLEELFGAVPAQPLHLALALGGERERSGWWGEGRAACWADAIQAVREVAEALGVEVGVRAAALAPWHPGRCAELRLDDRVIGHAGELHPGVCTDLGLPGRTSAAEIDLDAVLAHAADAPPAPRLSGYPVAKEDVALVVDDAVDAAVLASTLREGAGPLCEEVRMFDLYTGPQIGEGRKSLAFSLRFRAPDRTLTEQETSAARDAAVAAARDRLGAEQRS